MTFGNAELGQHPKNPIHVGPSLRGGTSNQNHVAIRFCDSTESYLIPCPRPADPRCQPPLPNFSSTLGGPFSCEPLAWERKWGWRGWGSEPSCGLGQQVSAFQTLTAVGVFLLAWMQPAVFVCMCLYTHTHILTSTRVHDQNTSISPPHAFLQAAKIQKNKIKFLIIAKSSETNITSTGQVFFFPRTISASQS